MAFVFGPAYWTGACRGGGGGGNPHVNIIMAATSQTGIEQ